ncbi:unnamed protein product [Ceutorhynchus assimilis]|uniref:Uncharacterized protein n=1 Tax=Ceutorhynchus assimilis TaxID=467358 RepID=A0A9N9QB77_9CUCU|nr:unnamed protein product [Ceutorhynchus assimilis]
MRLWIFLLLLAPHCFASKCKTCRGQQCENNSETLLERCTIFSSTVPFANLAHSDNKELLNYGCLELKYSKGSSNEVIQKCVMAENLDTICTKIAEKISYQICNVQIPIEDQDSMKPEVRDLPNPPGLNVDIYTAIIPQEPTKSTDSKSEDSTTPDSNNNQFNGSIGTSTISDSTKSVTYDIWGDSSSNNNGLLVTTQSSLSNPETTVKIYSTEVTIIEENTESENNWIVPGTTPKSTTESWLDNSPDGAEMTTKLISTNEDDLGLQQTETNGFKGPTESSIQNAGSEQTPVASNFDPNGETAVDFSDSHTTKLVSTMIIPGEESTSKTTTTVNYNEDNESSTINAIVDGPNYNIPSTESHSLDDFGDIPSGNVSNEGGASGSDSTSPTEESNPWQDSSTVVEASDSFDVSSQKSPSNSNMPDNESHSLDDLGDIPLENNLTSTIEESDHLQDSSTRGSFDDSTQSILNNSPSTEDYSLDDLGDNSSGNVSNEGGASESDSTSPIDEYNHWQDSSTTGSLDDSTQKNLNPNIPGTESHSLDNLGDIPSENKLNGGEASNPYSSSSIEKPNHWQDSSTTGSLDESTQESPNNSDIPVGTESHLLDDLGDIPLENKSNGGDASYPYSTSPIEESNHWQDYPTTGSLDESTQKSPNNFEIPDTESHPLDDSGNILLENKTNGEESSYPYSTPPIEESNNWQDFSTTGSLDESTQESPNNSDIPVGTESRLLDDLGDNPLENKSNGVESSYPYSTSPIEESNHWQNYSTTDSLDESTQKSSNNSDIPVGTESHLLDDLGDIPLENKSNGEESSYPDSTSSIEESNHWQDSSTTGSLDDSTQKSPNNSDIPVVTESHLLDDLGNIPLENKSNGGESSYPYSTSPIEESNNWQDSSTTGSLDDSTQKNLNPNIPGAQGYPLDDSGDIPLQNTSNGEEASDQHLTTRIDESDHSQDSFSIVDKTTSKDFSAIGSFDDSTVKTTIFTNPDNKGNSIDDLGHIPTENVPTFRFDESYHLQNSSTIAGATKTTDSFDSSTPHSNIPDFEGNFLDDLGDIHLETASNEEASNPYSTVPIEESNHWQGSSVVAEATTRKDLEDSIYNNSTQKSPSSLDNLENIPSQNALNEEEARFPYPTLPIEESNHWQDSLLDDSSARNPNSTPLIEESTLVEATTIEDQFTVGSFDDSTPNSPTFNISGTNDFDSNLTIHWQDSIIIGSFDIVPTIPSGNDDSGVNNLENIPLDDDSKVNITLTTVVFEVTEESAPTVSAASKIHLSSLFYFILLVVFYIRK